MLSDYFDKTVIIERKVSSNNGFGGQTNVWSTHLTINCLIDYIENGQDKLEITNQYLNRSQLILMTNTGYDITIYDRVNLNGVYYRIVNIDEPFSKHAEIYLEKSGVDN